MDSLRRRLSRKLSGTLLLFALATLVLGTSGCSREPIDAAASFDSESSSPSASIPATSPNPDPEDGTNAVATNKNEPADEPLNSAEPSEAGPIEPVALDDETGDPADDALLAEMAENGGDLERALRAISVTVKESSRGDIVLVGLKGPHITDAALEKIKNLETLLVIDIWDAPVTDAGLAQLTDMTQLRALGLRHTNITNNGLRHLSKLSALKELNLTLTRVSDAGLQHLTTLKSLQKLGLDDTLVTGNGINELQGSLPNCQIAW